MVPTPEEEETTGVSGPPIDAVTPQGSKLGRFVVLGDLGAGGMGRVMRAFDPELGREVALKRLHADGPEASARAIREAQAVASLNHPNVVAVYDFGEHDEAIFIALELVEGKTLREWMNEGPHPWRLVLDRLEAAGRGLAAAHRVGLVHRDFKPSNVLVGDDGRVRVTDFGLARFVAAPSDAVSGGASDSLASGDVCLTRSGIVLGTPAYMAPEQHGGASDPSCDQYGFCVVLFEALYGERPFRGDTMRELIEAKRKGEPAMPRGYASVPARLRRVVCRGLAPRPGDRFAAMDDLLAALADARRARSPMIAAVAGAVVLTGVAVWVNHSASVCAGAEAQLAGIWDAERRGEIEDALARTEVAYASTTATRVLARIDDYATAWVAGHEDACVANRVRDEQSAVVLDARMHCLDGRRRSLAAVVDVLAAADTDVLERAVQATAQLPAVDRCADVEYVQATVAPPEDAATATKVAALRDAIARLDARRGAGKLDGGIAEARTVLADAEATGYTPVVAEARLELGGQLVDGGEPAESLEAYRTTYFEAHREGMSEVAATASSQIVFVLGEGLGRPDEALEWAEHARVEAARVGDPAAESQLAHALGAAHFAAGHLDDALREYEHAREIDERILDENDPSLGIVYLSLGSVHGARGEYEAALEDSTRALEIMRASLGPDHPEVHRALSNIGSVHLALGHFDLAADFLEQALAIAESSLGREHPLTAAVLNNLGIAYTNRNQHERALAVLERALAIREKALGPGHPDVGNQLISIGNAHRARSDFAAAEPAYARAAVVFEAAFGHEHPAVAMALNNLGVVHEARRAFPEAAHAYREAIVIFEKTLGPKHVNVASAHHNLGNVLEQLGEPAEALPHHETAYEIRSAALPTDHPQLVNARESLERVRAAVRAG